MATIADVARSAGVSKGTASRVLNNPNGIAVLPATVERIQRAAAELQYRPNALARALATGRTHALGLLVRSMTDPHAARMLEAVEARARALGYHLLVSTELAGFLDQERVDGILAIGTPEDPHLAALSGAKPTVFICNRTEPPACNYVGWDDYAAAYELGQYLLALGHRRIAAIFGDRPPHLPQPPKIRGFRQALCDAGVTATEYRSIHAADGITDGRLLTQQLLADGEPPTAIFARNDYLAVGAIAALREAGVAVPAQVSVVGYNDTPLARACYPRLTTVRTPFPEAGELALERLVEAVEKNAAPFATILLPTQLVVRESSGERSRGSIEC